MTAPVKRDWSSVDPVAFRAWLLSRVSVSRAGYATPCWLWTGFRNARGYARGGIPKKTGSQFDRCVNVHRAAYAILTGCDMGELQTDHLCRNRSCVNPAHLEPVTAAENVRRIPNETRAPQYSRVRQGFIQCTHSGEITPSGVCRGCKREYMRLWRQQARADRHDETPAQDRAA